MGSMAPAGESVFTPLGEGLADGADEGVGGFIEIGAPNDSWSSQNVIAAIPRDEANSDTHLQSDSDRRASTPAAPRGLEELFPRQNYA